MGDLILAIDQGTTGTTALVIDHEVRVVSSHSVEFPNHYPRPGEVEHDPDEIWSSVAQAVSGALARRGIAPERLAAIGITNQRETCLFWDRRTGRPLHRAIVWQDRRTAPMCERLRAEGHEPRIRELTGLVVDPYFSGTKARWLLDAVPGAREAAARGDLCFGTIDSWLCWRFTGAHVTDPSNASRTLLFDIHRLEWSDELLHLFGIPAPCLPEVGDNAAVHGTTRGAGFLPDGIPVAGLVGDQQGALFGQACFRPGTAKCTYGTGAFILLNTGGTLVRSNHGMLTTVGWRLGDRTTYALEGSAFVAGAAVQWLRDGLGIVRSASEIEALARTVPDAGGVTFVPALTGLGAPHWRPEARGVLTGLTRGTTRAHLARAALDGIALQIDDILRAMIADAGPLTELRVDGGAAANGLLVQRQADLLGVPCIRPRVLETTGLGSGLLAGLAVGFWDGPDAVETSWAEEARFVPSGDPEEIAATRARWAEAVAKA